ncbi:(2Fe-2S)-binding protein [Allonocardiopsis opalescens]|uniref:Ferric iron reductase FhuF-like transporter n=1 Tax=Allonocardiopsis opalescens TaxID=1144618 RepID=A0A2T0QE15_9ACTN|nr:(2Fe-2S)-binding protein [Allonocardiopsis opalescens]PRY02177.1 ferric iron reductase FhuF-like transporter [Allonocardiopsis opalescens]
MSVRELGALSGTAEAADGWLPGSAMLDPDVLRTALRSHERLWKAPEHVAAALWWKAYTYWVALEPATRWMRTGTGAEVGLDHVELQLDSDLRCVRLRPPGGRGTPPPAALADAEEGLSALVEAVVVRHLEPVGRTLADVTRLGARGMWGSIMSGLAWALLDDDTATLADVERLLDAVPCPYGRLVDPAELVSADGAAKPYPLRRTCCFYYQVPGGQVCLTCPLLSDAQRDEITAPGGQHIRRPCS